jgi:hypothetical protein
MQAFGRWEGDGKERHDHVTGLPLTRTQACMQLGICLQRIQCELNRAMLVRIYNEGTPPRPL